MKGAPLVVVRYDKTGLHFSPDRIVGGTYDVCFIDNQSALAGRKDVVFDVFVTGPGLAELSVLADHTGGGMLCPGAEAVTVTVDGRILNVNQNFEILPSSTCGPPVT